jgi:hypothetical protein
LLTFRALRISQCARKLAQRSTLIKKKSCTDKTFIKKKKLIFALAPEQCYTAFLRGKTKVKKKEKKKGAKEGYDLIQTRSKERKSIKDQSNK